MAGVEIEKLKPAAKADVAIYMPYYSKNKQSDLPYAISLYQLQFLEGARQIEGGESIPFVATWSASKLPAELTPCQLQFDGQAELSYEVRIQNDQFIDYLIELIQNYKKKRITDFPGAFYRKLLRFES